MSRIPERQNGESNREYYTRVLNAAPEGSVVRFDEARGLVNVVRWGHAGTDAEAEGFE
jgi:hypothetical protein